MAALIILGAFALPTLFGMRGDTRVKAGADTIRARMQEARAKAMEHGQPYRLALSGDQKRLLIAPDAAGALPSDEEGAGPVARENGLPDGVTAEVLLDEFDQSTQDEAGWVRVATFLPDGTCREDSVEVEVREAGSVPYVVRLRGLTGAVTVIRGILEANR
jgi:Tfp pilus assembly protein FimT